MGDEYNTKKNGQQDEYQHQNRITFKYPTQHTVPLDQTFHVPHC